jgi:hypothetical protein
MVIAVSVNHRGVHISKRKFILCNAFDLFVLTFREYSAFGLELDREKSPRSHRIRSRKCIVPLWERREIVIITNNSNK